MLVYADLHVHIGQAKNRFVKITASKNLTITNAINYSKEIKGLDVLGVVDCGSKVVLQELDELLTSGELIEQEGGGLKAENDLLLVLGWEMELEDAHYLTYLPNIVTLKELTKELWPRTKNQELSTQRFLVPENEVRTIVESLGGIFMPAHAFTPHKGFYGKRVDSLFELFERPFTAIEMGLSSSTSMIAGIKELEKTSFLANSDAHSLAKIAREYNELKLESLDFNSLKKALENEDIVANYGLDPMLGKYYETGCINCGKKVAIDLKCACGGYSVKGVKPRLDELGGFLEGRKRPPYIKQIPLEFLPFIGPKTIEKLLLVGTELEILNKTPIDELKKVTNERVALIIQEAREKTFNEGSRLTISQGRAGFYGKVSFNE